MRFTSSDFAMSYLPLMELLHYDSIGEKPVQLDGEYVQKLLSRVFDRCAEVANARLAEMLAEVPVVYADKKECITWWDEQPSCFDTHTARLICIEPIKEKT